MNKIVVAKHLFCKIFEKKKKKKNKSRDLLNDVLYFPTTWRGLKWFCSVGGIDVFMNVSSKHVKR